MDLDAAIERGYRERDNPLKFDPAGDNAELLAELKRRYRQRNHNGPVPVTELLSATERDEAGRHATAALFWQTVNAAQRYKIHVDNVRKGAHEGWWTPALKAAVDVAADRYSAATARELFERMPTHDHPFEMRDPDTPAEAVNASARWLVYRDGGKLIVVDDKLRKEKPIGFRAFQNRVKEVRELS